MIKLGIFAFVSITIVTSLTLDHRNPVSSIQYADQVDVPFNAVYVVDNRITCGAVILSSTVAMTAAHCVPFVHKKSSVYVGVPHPNGNAGGVRKHVERTLIHEAYNGTAGRRDNDIALLFLNTDSPFAFNKFVQPSVLPSENDDYQQSTLQAYVASWGDNRYLKFSVVRLTPRENCINQIGEVGKNVICAKFEDKRLDACEDNGILFIGNKVIGLSSFGWACGIMKYPAGYTDIARLRKWIRHHTGV